MTLASAIEALALPGETRVDKRVPKKLLLEQGAPTTSDKRQIQDGIAEIVWISALKPHNIGVPAFTDEIREYLEIAVLTLTLRDAARANRLSELIHRAIPYPVVLWTEGDGTASLSLAHKRWSQSEAGEVVVEEVYRSPWLRPDAPSAAEAAFLGSLALAELPTRDLYALYQGWLDRLATFEAAAITGIFALPETVEHAAARRDALAEHARLAREIAGLRAEAEKETQIGRLVDLNLEIARLRNERAAIEKMLGAKAAE